MTQEHPRAGDVFINERKRRIDPESSWLYYLVKPKHVRKPVNPFDPVNRTWVPEPGWAAIYGPGRTAGRMTSIRTARIDKLTYIGTVGERFTIPPLTEEAP